MITITRLRLSEICRGVAAGTRTLSVRLSNPGRDTDTTYVPAGTSRANVPPSDFFLYSTPLVVFRATTDAPISAQSRASVTASTS